jgi:hypothetical protein
MLTPFFPNVLSYVVISIWTLGTLLCVLSSLIWCRFGSDHYLIRFFYYADKNKTLKEIKRGTEKGRYILVGSALGGILTILSYLFIILVVILVGLLLFNYSPMVFDNPRSCYLNTETFVRLVNETGVSVASENRSCTRVLLGLLSKDTSPSQGILGVPDNSFRSLRKVAFGEIAPPSAFIEDIRRNTIYSFTLTLIGVQDFNRHVYFVIVNQCKDHFASFCSILARVTNNTIQFEIESSKFSFPLEIRVPFLSRTYLTALEVLIRTAKNSSQLAERLNFHSSQISHSYFLTRADEVAQGVRSIPI